jgi:hypothetical protein
MNPGISQFAALLGDSASLPASSTRGWSLTYIQSKVDQGSKGRVGTFTDLSPVDHYGEGPANHTQAVTMCPAPSTIDQDVAVVIRNSTSRVLSWYRAVQCGFGV